MLKPCDSDFNIERHVIPFLNECAFFAELSRHLPKIATRDIPTAAVTYDMKSDQIALYYNPEFMESLTNWEIKGVLTHEFYHLTFGHLNVRRKSPAKMWNVATDLAINSIIVENASRTRVSNDDGSDSRPLPKGALIPGQLPVMSDEGEKLMKENDSKSLAALIASFPKMQASEWYFNKIMDFVKKLGKKNGGGNGGGEGFDDWFDSFDDHDAWDEIPEEHREYVEGKVKALVEQATRHADSTSTGWGHIPADLRDEIRRSVSSVINWRAVLRQFIGSLVRGGRTTSIKRINRRYPYVHPGIKRSYVAKLLIARDESGSVHNEMLAEFFGELATLTKKVEIDFLPFDCYCNVKDVVRWSKGSIPDKATKRTRGGGTDFNAPSDVFNDPKNRGRWDGLLIMTDGMAPAPGPVRGKRGWILGNGCTLEFPTTELTINITKDKPVTGAWR
jgi:predicted metal-dependent peptidase